MNAMLIDMILDNQSKNKDINKTKISANSLQRNSKYTDLRLISTIYSRDICSRYKTITSATQLNNGDIIMVDYSGGYEIVSLIDDSLKTTKYVTGEYNKKKRNVIELSTGIILISNNNTCTIYNRNMDVIKIAIWDFLSEINEIIELNNTNVLVLGDRGRFILLNQEMKIIKSGVNITNTQSALQLSNNDILITGNYGLYEIFSEDMIVKKNRIWSNDTHAILTSLQLSNGNILLAGMSGKYEIFDSDMNSITTGIWNIGNQDIYTSLQLHNGDILLAGGDGRYELLDINMNSLIDSAWRCNGRIFKAIQLTNDNVILCGYEGKYEVLRIGVGRFKNKKE